MMLKMRRIVAVRLLAVFVALASGPLYLSLAGCQDGDPGPEGLTLRVVTFNTGSGGPPGVSPTGEFTLALKTIADEHYGNGLAWIPAVEATARFLADLRPDVVAFQEIFYTEDCSTIPETAWEGFVCESWQPGERTVAQVVLGEGYQVMCHQGKPDKCAAVREEFGSFVGCQEPFCLEGLRGSRVEDCGSGARVGRGTIQLAAGGTLTVVSFHGSSGVGGEDADCRQKQVNQVFVDLGLGDGEPGANGARNLVLGDLNADPVRWASFDASAARWLDFVQNPDDPTASRPFRFLSQAGQDAEPTYAALFNIDHVISDSARGSCFVPGLDPGHPHVMGAEIHFDHLPVVCDLELTR